MIYDLDGNSYVTRNKADIISREEALGFSFRTVDPRRRFALMGRDYILQSEAYRVMCLQQGRTRLDQRLEAFESCGHMDRIQGVVWVALPDVADTQVDILQDAELSVK